MIIVIDNYDSFIYNIASYYQSKKKDIQVIRNDKQSVEQIISQKPELIILSPGPKSPKEAGICINLIQHVATMDSPIPLFGVCLGCQSLAQAYNANIITAKKMYHGKISSIEHNNKGLFRSLENPIVQTRYHSLVIDKNTLSNEYEISATSEDGEIMGIQHKSLPFEGVQFHPESIASVHGTMILDNALYIGK